MDSLGENKIGDAGAQDLGAALQVNTTLTTLEWGLGCGIESRWCVAIVLKKTMLVVFTFISLSSLVSNSIGETGARELLTALQFNKALAKL
jgi:hypothetical protein